MTVYVDNMLAPLGRMKMCHMGADSTEELILMADKIGVQRKWIQFPGTWKEHYDICRSKRDYAVSLGAREVSMISFFKNLEKKRKLRERTNEQTIIF